MNANHSHGVCLSCGGHVDEDGMSKGGEVEESLEADASGAPVGDETEDMAAKNARDFALSLQRAR